MMSQILQLEMSDNILPQLEMMRQHQEHELECLHKIQSVMEEVRESPYQTIMVRDQLDWGAEQRATSLLKRQVFFAAKMQDQVVLVQQYISEQEIDLMGFLQCTEYLHTHLVQPFCDYHHKNSAEFNPRILTFVERHLQACQQRINNLYGELFHAFLADIAFPTKSKADKLVLVHYSAYEVIAVINTLSYSLSGCAKLRSVGVRVTCIEWTIFDILNEACAYHFIESSQRTARSDKPEWFFIYLYETLEANLMQLEDLDRAKENDEFESAKNQFALLLYELYCLHNIQKKVTTNRQDLVEQPEIAITFMESAQLFEQNVRQIVNIKGIYSSIVDMLYAEGVIESVLLRECGIFEENLFSQMRLHIKSDHHDKKGVTTHQVNLYLSFIDDFVLIWKKLRSKYQGIETTHIMATVEKCYHELVFKPFCELSGQYFKLIHVLTDEAAKVNFLQTFAVGVATLREQCSEQVDDIKSMQRSTIKAYIHQIVNRMTDAIMKQVYPYVMNEVCVPVYQCRDKVLHLYKNQGFYFLEQCDSLVGVERLNNFYLVLLGRTRSIVSEFVLERHFNLKMSHLITKALSAHLARRMFEWACQSTKFSPQGIKVYCLVVVRTTIQIIMSQMSMDTSTHCLMQIKRIEQISAMASSERKLSEDVSEEDRKLIQKMNIVQ